MGEPAKILRWSTPGSVFLLIAGGVVVTAWAVLQHHAPTAAAQLLPTKLNGVGVAVGALASVPLGFVIYQMYYAAYAKSHGRILSFVHLDIAREAMLFGHPIENIEDDPAWTVRRVGGLHLRWPFHLRLPLGGGFRTLWLFEQDAEGAAREERTGFRFGQIPNAADGERPLGARGDTGRWTKQRREELQACRTIVKQYESRREHNWLQLESQVRSRLHQDGDSDRDFDEIERLADIYHTLGAAKSAVIFGWSTGAAWVLKPFVFGGQHDLWGLSGLFALGSLAMTGLVTTWLYLLLHHNREHCLRRRVSFMHTVLQRD